MTLEIISWSISTKVWDRAGIELATPGSAVRLASVARHVTDCATRVGPIRLEASILVWVFIYTHSSCMQAAKALASLRIYALIWAFIVGQCDKYQNLLCWIVSFHGEIRKNNNFHIHLNQPFSCWRSYVLHSSPIFLLLTCCIPVIMMYFQSGKQCGSWSDGFVRSQLIWIYSVFMKG